MKVGRFVTFSRLSVNLRFIKIYLKLVEEVVIDTWQLLLYRGKVQNDQQILPTKTHPSC